MNIKKNINSTEYASIGLSAIGTVAAIVTQQIAYIATPLTLSLTLSLINRQKELGRATKRLANLEQQSQSVRDSFDALPSAPTTIDFNNLQQGIIDDRKELKRLRTVILEIDKKDRDLSPFLTEIDLTKDSIKQLGLNLSNFQKQFSESQDSIRVANTDLLLQEVAGNLSNISANFLDVESLDSTSPLKDRSLNLEKVDRGTIYSSIEELKFKIQSLEENSIVAEESIKQIGWRFLTLEKAFDDRQDPIEIANIQRSLSEIENSVSEMSATAAMTKSEYILELAKLELASNTIYLSIEQIESKIRLLTNNYSTIDIYDRIGDLDASLSDLHDYNLSLNNKIESYDRYEISEIVDAIILDKKIDDLIQQRVDRSVREKFDPVEKILPRQYSHDLVCDREKSRQIFLESLSQSEQRLILVCPWLTEYAINLDVQASIRAALDRGVLIDIGWGNLKDVNNDRSRLSKEILLNSKAKKWGGYGAVDWVYELQAEYADLLNLKILGTHEKFLVCDRKFAMLGSHNYMTSNTSSSEREVGIKTDNPELIEQLIELFDSPKYREGQRVDLQ